MDTIPQVADDTARQIPRLSVRPRAMATGTQTQRAGLAELDGLPGYYVYVPPQCVGQTRSPLIVLLHGGGRSGAQEVAKFQSLADHYGMILLAGNAVQPGRWDIISGWGTTTRYIRKDGLFVVSEFPERDVRNIDTALTRVLRTHAIDPEQIALLGFSDGGSYSLFLGLSNLDVFSRIASLSAMTPFDGIGPANPTTQIFLSGGFGESALPKRTLTIAQTLRQRGHPVMTQIGLRSHVDHVEDEYFVWAWLQQSWVDPAITTRGVTEADSDPVLTEEALRKVTEFWRRFREQPTSIRNVLRMRHQMEVPLMLGSERTTVITMNLSAMATAVPAIAALLDSVGLTAHTATAYRNAIIRSGIARMVGMRTGLPTQESVWSFKPIIPTSVLGKNMEFWEMHPALFTDLESTGMWQTQ